MSNRGQVWDHKSLLKPKSFSKSPPDRILVPDYKFMVAIIHRIVSYYYGSFHFFLKNCIFLENTVKSESERVADVVAQTVFYSNLFFAENFGTNHV